MTMVNIKGLNKAQLLNMMTYHTEIVSMWWGLQNDTSSPEEEAVKRYIDQYNGVKIGIDFTQDEVNSYVYNRNAGPNMLERIVAQLRNEENQVKKNE
jgi:hypothetical protein